MSKEKIFIVILIFLLFLVMGFCAASQGFGKLLGFLSDTPPTPPMQVNYIYIHVDAIENKNPKVLSIWGIFTYQGDPVSIKARSLYPSKNLQGDLAANAFALAPDGLPTPEFINLVKTTFDIPIDNYLVVDDNGVSILYAWANDIDPKVVIDTQAPPDLRLFESGCERIRDGRVKQGISAQWDLLYPDHFRTNFGFDEFMVQWKTIVEAGSSLDCEALNSTP